jgi:predicted Zn-dependent protease
VKKFPLVFIALAFFGFSAEAAPGMREINDTEIETVVEKLIQPIARAAKIPDRRLRVHIIADNDLNAFVSSGEDIYIYAGTIMKLENPNAFQAVVAHELGHIIGGHYTNMMSRVEKELVAAIIMQSLGIALLAINPEAGAGVMMGAPGITQSNLMAFSRDEERLADMTGLGLLKSAGLPRGGFIEMMEIMHGQNVYIENAKNHSQISHPTTAERLMNGRQWILKNGGDGGELPKDLVREYQMARAKLIGYLQSEKSVQDLYPSKNSVAAKYARAISDLRRSKLKTALKTAQELSKADKSNPYFFELAGDIYMQTGKYSDAIESYEKSLSLLEDESMQISAALALALVERNEKDDAAEATRKAKRALILAGPSAKHNPFLYFILARAYASQNMQGLSDWATAEYNWSLGKKKEAKKFAERAKKVLPADSAEYKKSEDILRKE